MAPGHGAGPSHKPGTDDDDDAKAGNQGAGITVDFLDQREVEFDAQAADKPA